MIVSMRWSEVASRLGELFEYPSEGFSTRVVQTSRNLGECPEVIEKALESFSSELIPLSLGQLQELHTRSFTLAPSCIPYVGVYLFGEESFKRGDLLARLKQAYSIHSFDAGSELPDHVGVLLRFSRHLDHEELEEFRNWMLALPIEKMAKDLASTQNPYRHLLEGLRLLVVPEGVSGDVLDLIQAASGTRSVSPGGGSSGGCSPSMRSARS